MGKFKTWPHIFQSNLRDCKKIHTLGTINRAFKAFVYRTKQSENIPVWQAGLLGVKHPTTFIMVLDAEK